VTRTPGFIDGENFSGSVRAVGPGPGAGPGSGAGRPDSEIHRDLSGPGSKTSLARATYRDSDTESEALALPAVRHTSQCFMHPSMIHHH
jgi:hypothetical protein